MQNQKYFPIEKTSGIVEWDFGEEAPRGPRLTIQQWVKRLKQKGNGSSRIIRQGLYPKRGVKRKLKATNHIIKHLEEQKALRRDFVKSYTTQKVYNVLSIAQVISAVAKKSLEEIIIDNPIYNADNNPEPCSHIKTLWKAYTGERWFESFKSNERRKLKKGTKFPLLREWQIIPKASLDHVLNISKNTIYKLDDRGFIIPKENRDFISHSLHNHVNPKALAQFLALLSEKPISRLYLNKKSDNSYHDILQNLVNKKVIPYLKEHDLNPEQNYTLKEIREKTGILENALRSWVFSLKAMPYEYITYVKNRKRVIVKGIDLALYALRGEKRKKQMTVQEIANLFGIEENKVSHLHLPYTKNKVYGSQQYVYPVYNVFCEDIRKRYGQN